MSNSEKFNEIKKLLLKGKYEEAQDIMYDGIDAEICDDAGNNILHLLATIKGTKEGASLDTEELASLLSYALEYIEATSANTKGEYPLISAAKAGQARMVKELFAADESLAIDYVDDKGDNILLILISENVDDEECANAVDDILCEAEDFLHSQDDEKGDTPLHKAARYGLLQTVEMLLDWGADIDTLNTCDKATATQVATLAGHSQIVKALEHDLNIANKPPVTTQAPQEDEAIDPSDVLGNEELKHKVISININKLFNEKRMSLYETIRKYWKLSPARANQADFVLAEFGGEIRAVFKPDANGWQASEEHKGRYFFEGEEVFDEEIKSLYVGKKVIKLRGQANPVKYWYK